MDMPVFRVSDTLLSCTPSQNGGGLLGAQPVRLFDSPKTVNSMKQYLLLCCFFSCDDLIQEALLLQRLQRVDRAQYIHL